MNRRIAIAVLLGLSASPAVALDDYDPNDISQLSNAAIEAMIKTVAVGGSHKAYLSAKPLDLAVGIDLGITADIIAIPQEFKDALALVSGQPATGIPAMVPLPKIALYKGLPLGFDLGFSYIAYQDVFKSVGGAVRYGRQMPALLGGLWVNAQLSGNYTKILFLSTHTYSVDFTASKGFAIVEPYVGLGIRMWSGDLQYTATSGNFQAGVSGHKSGTSPSLYFGLPINLVVLKLTAQIDHNFSGVTTYGAKLALSL